MIKRKGRQKMKPYEESTGGSNLSDIFRLMDLEQEKKELERKVREAKIRLAGIETVRPKLAATTDLKPWLDKIQKDLKTVAKVDEAWSDESHDDDDELQKWQENHKDLTRAEMLKYLSETRFESAALKSQRRKHEFCLCVQQVIFDLEQVLSLYGFTDYYRERAHAEIVGRNMDLLKPIPQPILSEEREYTRVVDSLAKD